MTSATSPVVRTADERRRTGSLAWHVGALLVLAVVLYPVIWVLGASFKPSKDIIASLDLLPGRPGLGELLRARRRHRRHLDRPASSQNSLIVRGPGRGRRGDLLLADGVRLRQDPVRRAEPAVHPDDRHPAAAVPRAAHPAVRDVPEARLINTSCRWCCGKYLATEAFFVFLMVQFMRGPAARAGRGRASSTAAGICGSTGRSCCRCAGPALITSAIFTFINAWNDFMGPLIYLNSPAKYTVSLGLMMFRDQEGISNYGSMIAMSLVALVPVVAFFLAFQRYLIDGMATSGLKG